MEQEIKGMGDGKMGSIHWGVDLALLVGVLGLLLADRSGKIHIAGKGGLWVVLLGLPVFIAAELKMLVAGVVEPSGGLAAFLLRLLVLLLVNILLLYIGVKGSLWPVKKDKTATWSERKQARSQAASSIVKLGIVLHIWYLVAILAASNFYMPVIVEAAAILFSAAIAIGFYWWALLLLFLFLPWLFIIFLLFMAWTVARLWVAVAFVSLLYGVAAINGINGVLRVRKLDEMKVSRTLLHTLCQLVPLLGAVSLYRLGKRINKTA